MDLENYFEIANYTDGMILKTGESAKVEFDGSCMSGESNRLFFTGETGIFYFWKSEPNCQFQYLSIEDALDHDHAEKARYCINLTNKKSCNYIKKLYKKIMWQPNLGYLTLVGHNESWHGGIFAKANDLNIEKDGYLRVIFEIRLKKDGVSRHSVKGEPDFLETVNIPAGTYNLTEYFANFTIPHNTASVACIIEGYGYTGNIYIESPFLISSNNFNVVSDFATSVFNQAKFDWLGQNLSRKEWPEFKISLNGKCFFEGERFERCHRLSEIEIDIPQSLIRNGKNLLEIKLISDYRDAVNYNLHSVAIVSTPNDDVEIVACPENVTVNKPFGILIKTKTSNAKITCGESNYTFAKVGLNVIPMIFTKAENNAKININNKTCIVSRVVKKEEDGIVTGTGDLVYINQNLSDYDAYISWYLSNNVGNLLTIRPTYRWSGSRTLNSDAFESLVGILNACNIKYSHMIDGRELPGFDANPTNKMLEGKGFLGRQTHEYDGGCVYWQASGSSGCNVMDNIVLEQLYDMFQLLANKAPETSNMRSAYPNRIEYGDTIRFYRDRRVESDMQKSAEFFVEQLRKTKFDATRHTGPSVLFKYFYQAGYKWTGAELVYGPTEIICASIRGAQACYNSPTIGAHNAIQWSTSPHDTPERFRRYRLSLYVAYMQGINEINTEEGLWRLEEYYSPFNRFSAACKGHLAEQQDFYRYVSSHTRSGKFHTDFAVMSGRYDGWRSFGIDEVWGRHQEEFAACDAERSFELLKIFYPLSNPNGSIYFHNCPNKPIGLYTGTPEGNIDIVPIEDTAESFMKYKLITFLGYNKALPEDMDKLEKFVKNGGTLLLTWAHLSITTNRKDVVDYKHEYIEHPFVKLFASGKPEFVSDTINEKPIFVCKNSVGIHQAETDSKNALITVTSYGKGEVILFNVNCYPANPSIKDYYETAMSTLNERCLINQKSLIRCENNVQYTKFKQNNETEHIYLLAVDWYNNPDILRYATLEMQQHKYEIKFKFGTMLKIVTNGEIAVWCEDETGDVLSISNSIITLQGSKEHIFNIAKDGKLTTEKYDLTNESIRNITLG